MPLFSAVGDIMVNREEPLSALASVRNVIRGSDIAFGQLETPYSHLGSMGSSGPRGAIAHDPRNYVALPDAGFDVISLASNHMMDWGADALKDIRERLDRDGILAVGAGENIAEARRPVILERDGATIAVLAYCSVAPSGYYAVESRPGVAPMRAITHYEALEEDQPGTPAEVLTFPNPLDLQQLVQDVEMAKEAADVVVLSMHWGVHFARAVIADYQRVVARRAIDAGVGLVVGHHPHILKGIEFYKGACIAYSLGNFVFDEHGVSKAPDLAWNKRRFRVYKDLYGMPDRQPGSRYVFQADARFSMILQASITTAGVQQLAYLPVVIDRDANPQVVAPDSSAGREVIAYLTGVTEEAELECSFRPEQGRVGIYPAN